MADEKEPPQKRDPAARKPDGQFGPGNRANPGGKPKKIREIEKMLDDEHRTPEKMRETFALIRQVAHGVEEPVFYQGAVCGAVMKYDGAWMNLYLRRVLGPEREIEVDLTDAPDEVLRWWADNVN